MRRNLRCKFCLAETFSNYASLFSGSLRLTDACCQCQQDGTSEGDLGSISPGSEIVELCGMALLQRLGIIPRKAILDAGLHGPKTHAPIRQQHGQSPIWMTMEALRLSRTIESNRLPLPLQHFAIFARLSCGSGPGGAGPKPRESPSNGTTRSFPQPCRFSIASTRARRKFCPIDRAGLLSTHTTFVIPSICLAFQLYQLTSSEVILCTRRKSTMPAALMIFP